MAAALGGLPEILSKRANVFQSSCCKLWFSSWLSVFHISNVHGDKRRTPHPGALS